MKFRTVLMVLGLVLVCSPLYALPTYYTADGVLPADLGVLQAERTVWQNAYGSSLSSEGFESFTAGNSIDFGDFTISLFGGDGFTQISGNNLITTEGNSVIDFYTLGTTAVEFTFDNAINAFGIDLTSIDQSATTASFYDENGNFLNDFATGQWAGASFFGVINDQAFTTARFEFTNSEWLNFDYMQYGGSPNPVVPEPGTLTLLGLGLVGLAGAIRRKNSK